MQKILITMTCASALLTSCVCTNKLPIDEASLKSTPFTSGEWTQEEVANFGSIDDAYINDKYFETYAIKQFTKLLEGASYTNQDDLKKQSENKFTSEKFKTTKIKTKLPKDLYHKLSASTVMIFALNPCPNPKCKWHICGVSTGFVIGEDGYIATNNHVVQLRGPAVTLGVMTRDGQCFLVDKVLAADKEHDVALLKIKNAKNVKLPALGLRPNAPIGTPVNIVSHPTSNFYMLTQGVLSRRAKWIRRSNPTPPVQPQVNKKEDAPKSDAQKVNPEIAKNQGKQIVPKLIFADTIMTDADYAGGSSGGALCDEYGNVIGIVSSTRTVSPPGAKAANSQQMVLHFCVPVEKLIDLFFSKK